MKYILKRYYKTFFGSMLAHKEEPTRGSLTIVFTPLEYLRAPLFPSEEASERSQDDAATDKDAKNVRRLDSC